jgi:hypothetical protein
VSCACLAALIILGRFLVTLSGILTVICSGVQAADGRHKVLDIVKMACRISRSDLLKKVSRTAKEKDLDETLETTARRAAALHSRQLAILGLGLASQNLAQLASG